MDVRMDGRVAVITGSSTGLGLAMAKEFAASGASVALLARKIDALTAAKAEVAKAAGKTNAKVEAYSCDVAKAQPIADTFKKVVADFGKVDIVVNNAGISHAKAFDTVTDEDWQGDLDLKLFAAIRLCRPPSRHARAQMGPHRQRAQHRRQGAGRQLDADQRQPRRGSRAHQGALQGERTAQRAGQRHAGRADRERPVGAPPQGRQGRGKSYEEYLQGMAKGRIPIGRMGKAEEFARMACFLCSDAGSFITGVAINVDGGASPVV